MKTVGITGGIGAGKSIVSRIFSILGAPVYDADSRAKVLMNTNPKVRKGVTELFGEESYSEGELNRVHIGKIAFHQPERLEQLNQLVHPEVAEDFKSWRQSYQSPYVLKEAALLVENGSYKALDHLIVVTSPSSVRKQRVLQRDPHRSEKDVVAIMERQLPESEKIAVADTIIHNDGTQLVLPQVIEAHTRLINA